MWVLQKFCKTSSNSSISSYSKGALIVKWAGSLDDLELEDGKKARNTLGVIIALILGTIGISIYSIFKYPQILIILILGEILDYSIYKSYKKYKKKKD